MKLKKKVLSRLDHSRVRVQLAYALDCTEQTIIRYIESNSDNLTKAAALAVIRKETGLTDAEILEEETEPVKNRA